MDEQFFFSISFCIFCLLTYKPIKRFILSLVDTRITSIRDRFEEAYRIEKDSSQQLEYAENRANESIKYSSTALASAKQVAEVEIMKMSLEFDRKIESLRQQSSLSMEHIKLKRIAEMKLQIADTVYNKAVESLSQ